MHDQVVLFSGGMDSIMLAQLYPHARLLYVPTGSQYEMKELVALNRLPGHLRQRLVVADRLSLAAYERADAIVPNRNTHLALIAANYASDILLGATAGDLSQDKDDTWAAMMTSLLRYTLSGKHFPDGGAHTVHLPIKHLTKGELVKRYMQSNGDPIVLAASISCYAKTDGHCGVCKACTRKWAAMEFNDVDSTVWDTPPWTALAWNEPLTLWHSSRTWRTAAEDAYTYKVLQRYGVVE